MKAKIKIRILLPALLLLCAAGTARAYLEPTQYCIGKGRIWVQDTVLCPGQTADLGIYLSITPNAANASGGMQLPNNPENPYPVQNYMFYLEVEDTSALTIVCTNGMHFQYGSYDYFMGTPVITEIQDGMQGSLVYNYQEGRGTQSQNAPEKGTLMVTWNGPLSGSFFPDPAKPLFKIRVRCRAQKSSTLTFQHKTVFFNGGDSKLNYDIDYSPTVIGTPEMPDRRQVEMKRLDTICTGSYLTLNAAGGVAYKWKELENTMHPGHFTFTGENTAHPVFKSQTMGSYLFQLQAFDSMGCWALDSVRVEVGQNYLNHVGIDPGWSFEDSGTSRLLRITGDRNRIINMPVKVRLTPEDIFPPGESEFILQGNKKEHFVSTLPLDNPAFVVAYYEDEFHCKDQASASLYVKGRQITGSINPFKVYRCGRDDGKKSIQLKLTVSGGSGHFLYSWSVKDIEYGAAGNPRFDNPNDASPTLEYKGVCAVSVSIYDEETGESAVLSDTMLFREWLHPSVDLVLDTAASGLTAETAGNTFCEDTRLVYRAIPVYPGDSALYQWRVNGIPRAVTREPYWESSFMEGDSLDVILVSNEYCVLETEALSKAVFPKVQYPVMMSLWAWNSSEPPVSNPCGDSVAMKLLYTNAGNDFRLQWYRNGKELIYDRYHTGTGDTDQMEMKLPRLGYYDRYKAVIKESSHPCLVFDEAHSDEVYINFEANSNLVWDEKYNFHPQEKMVPGPVEQTGTAACENSSFTLTTSVKYLPRQFALMWFKKTGNDSVPLGYYKYKVGADKEGNNSGLPALSSWIASHRDLARIWRENVAKPYVTAAWETDFDLGNKLSKYGYQLNKQESTRQQQQDGFKIILNDPEAYLYTRRADPALNPNYIRAGDTVYYVLYNLEFGCGQDNYSVRSEYFVPRITPVRHFSAEDLVLENALGPDEKACPLSPVTLVPRVKGLDGEEALCISYKNSMTAKTNFLQYMQYGTSWDEARGSEDTVFVGYAIPKGDGKITVTARTDVACFDKFPITKVFNLDDYLHKETPFRVEHNPNKVICEGDEVQYWATAGYYNSDNATLTEATDMTFAWSQSLSDLKAYAHGNRSVSGIREGASFSYVPENAHPGVDSAGTGDINDIKGITRWYLYVGHSATGCAVYDSVTVTMAYRYGMDVAIRPHIEGVWCDTALGTGDPGFRVEGMPYSPRAQYYVADIKGGTESSISWKWMVDGMPEQRWTTEVDTIPVQGTFYNGQKLGLIVRNTQITCLKNFDTVEVEMNMVKPMHLYTYGPQSVERGQTAVFRVLPVPVSTRPGAGIEEKIISDARYDWYQWRNDGGWTPVPTDGKADNEVGWDTLYASADNGGLFKVEVQDKNRVCPAVTGVMKTDVKVPAGVRLRVCESSTGKELKGFCSSDHSAVLASEQDGITSYSVVPSSGMLVTLDAEVENASGNAYAVYYKNGTPLMMVPLCRTRAENTVLSSLRPEVTSKIPVYEKGTKYKTDINPGDNFKVAYICDTLTVDGQKTHFDGMSFTDTAVNGPFKLVADKEVVCPGENVNLQALFTSPYAQPAVTNVTWTPLSELSNVSGRNASLSEVKKETVVIASARDDFACPWSDTVRIILSDSGFTVPFGLASADSVFCGDSTTVAVRAYLYNTGSSLGSVFKRIYYYCEDASGEIKQADSGYIAPEFTVKDGWRVYAKAYLNASCNYLASYSDTLYFRSLQPPVVVHKVPTVLDTIVCHGDEFTVKVGVWPEGSKLVWKSSMPPVSSAQLNNDTMRTFRADRSNEITFRASLERLPSCVTTESLYVGVTGREVLNPILELTCSEPDGWMCSSPGSAGEKDSVTYTLTTKFCDSVVWYVNGEKAAVNVYTLTRVPRFAGLEGPADTVRVQGFLHTTTCQESQAGFSNTVAIRRVSAPALALNVHDTLIKIGQWLGVEAKASVYDGPAPYSLWSVRDENGRFGNMNYVDVWNTSFYIADSLDVTYIVTAGQTVVTRHLPSCVGVDSVMVRVDKPRKPQEPEKPDEPVVPEVRDTLLYVRDTLFHKTGSDFDMNMEEELVAGEEFDTVYRVTSVTMISYDTAVRILDSVFRRNGIVFTRSDTSVSVSSNRVDRTVREVAEIIPHAADPDVEILLHVDDTLMHFTRVYDEPGREWWLHTYARSAEVEKKVVELPDETLYITDSVIFFSDTLFRRSETLTCTADTSVLFIDSMFRTGMSLYHRYDTVLTGISENCVSSWVRERWSVTDTVMYRSDTVAKPVCEIIPKITRLAPSASDTTVCPGVEVAVAFAVEPAGMALQWQLPVDWPYILSPDMLSVTVWPVTEGEVEITAYPYGRENCSSSASVHMDVLGEGAAAMPSLALQVDRDMVCGAEEVEYVLTAKGCDQTVWYVNGEVWQDGVADGVLSRVPRFTGLEGPADSVVVYGSRRATECTPFTEVWSNAAVVRRVEIPKFDYVTPDTTVVEGHVVDLYASASAADGPEPELQWIDVYGALLETGGTLRMEMYQTDVFRIRARQNVLAVRLPDCYAEESVTVTVIPDTSGTEPPEPPVPPTPAEDTVYEIYVPNTIILNSPRYEDRVLRVYGNNVKEVRLQVFDAQGALVFDKRATPDRAVWNGSDLLGYTVSAGIYTYKVRAWMTNGTVIDRQSWVSVIR